MHRDLYCNDSGLLFCFKDQKINSPLFLLHFLAMVAQSISGLPRSVRKNIFKVREKSGNFVKGQGRS